MTKIRTLIDNVIWASTVYPKGATVEVPDDVAVRLAEEGHAEFAEPMTHELTGVEAARAKLRGA